VVFAGWRANAGAQEGGSVFVTVGAELLEVATAGDASAFLLLQDISAAVARHAATVMSEQNVRIRTL
jgi:hypothetical protein